MVDWDWTVSKCWDTNVVFQTAVFLIRVVRNNKGHYTKTAKSATAFPELVYITVILSYVGARNCAPNRLNLCLLFLANVLMVGVLIVKTHNIILIK